MKKTDLKAAILDLVGKPKYRPAKPRVIAQRLGLPKDEAPRVRKLIKKMILAGELAYGVSHQVHPAPGGQKIVEEEEAPAKTDERPTAAPSPVAPAAPGRVVGVFRRHESGYGFVRPRGLSAEEAREKSVYVPARKARDAATGDVVVVRISGRGDRKGLGPRGEILEILERQTHQFVGSYFELDGRALVQVDGSLFSQPIVVGDPSASNAVVDDMVVFEMVRFPSHVRAGEGVITQVLGQRGTPGVDTLSIIHECGLPGEFPEEVLQEARGQADRFDESIPDDRHDATTETVITIDPVDARDFDDAISLEQTDHGHWRLGVHIADVSHFVRPGTALDREAYDRATSVYLPDQVIPMLPEIISNSLASLQPKKVRMTKSVYIEFTPDGVRTHVEMHSAAIRSARRFTYEQVDEFLEDPNPWRKKLGVKVHDLMGRMRDLASVLRKRRFRLGALAFNVPEVKIDLDKQGRVAGAHVVENTESHQIIEEFMLAANEAVADELASRGLHFLRRIHQAPVQRKLDAMCQLVNELGFKTASLKSRFDLQKLLDRVEGLPQQRAVTFSLLRSMQRAEYGPQPEGHYALASDCYCHFTSPIRRYPDLTVHRLVEAIVQGRKPTNDYDKMLVVGEHCSGREQRADQAERELTKIKLLTYMNERIGEEMDAVVTGVESFGLFVQGLELPAEGLLPKHCLPDDRYTFDRATHTLAGFRQHGVFRLGDLLRVAVANVDVDRRQLDFRFVARLPAAAVSKPSAPKRKKRPATKKTVAGEPARKKAKRKKKPAAGKPAQEKAKRKKKSTRGKPKRGR